MNIALPELLAMAKDLTVLGAVLVALWGGANRTWVWGHHYQEVLAREQWWRDSATSLQKVADQAVRLAERKRR